MTKLTAGKASVFLLTAGAVGSLMGYSLTSVFAVAQDARVYCHANSGASGYNYLNNPAWDNHFENNGTPKAGHELDFYTVEGDTDCDRQIVTPTPTVVPTNSPTPTLIPTQSPSPTVTPSPTPTLPATPPVSPSVTPTPSPTVTPTQSPSPTPTDVSTPTVTPTPIVQEEPTATPTPSPVPEVLGTSNDVCTNLDGVQTEVPAGWFQNGTGSTECRQFQFGGSPEGGNNPQGQVLGTSTTNGHVLGASTLAATGNIENYLMMLGLVLSTTSLYGLFAPSILKKN